MKKLLLGGCILFAAISSTSAQLPYLQNFETTMTNLPAGWSLGVATNHPGNPGWKFNNSFPLVGIGYWYYDMAPHTYCAYIDDIDNNTGLKNNYDTLYTSSFNCSAAADVFIGCDLNFNNYTGGEVGTIAVSIDGGVTWTTAVTLPVNQGDVSWYNGQVYDISSLAGGQSNVMIAFCWNNIGAISQGYAGWGMAVDNINVYAPPAYDLSAVQCSNQYLVTTGTPVTFSGTEFNWGSSTITSMDLNYTVNGGPKQTDNIPSISMNKLSNYNFIDNVPWTPATPGNYLVRFWTDNFNGNNADMNNVNDTLYAYYTVIDTIQPKMALFEEYMQASCNPCMYAGPNIESVLKSSSAFCNSFRYHVDWPGVDYMNNETQNLFVNTRVGYYGVNGVPDGRIDGTTDVSPGSVTTGNIQVAADLGSPLTINVTSCTYNPGTKTYSLQAKIKSSVAIPEGVKARVVLSVDTIKYDSNQSDEDPTNSFAPPLGSGSNPDSYYKYVKSFAQVAEEMLPSASGTTLTAFTANQTQTINVSWKQNHPWGETPKATHMGYDSLFPGEHMTVFIQEDQAAAKTEYTTPLGAYPPHGQTGALTTYVYQSASAPVKVVTGVEELTNGVYFNMYPNPTTGNTTIAFSIEHTQNVMVEVYNTLGEKVYSANQGTIESGEHTILINGQNLKSGIYFVRFTTDNVTTTKKLVIQK